MAESDPPANREPGPRRHRPSVVVGSALPPAASSRPTRSTSRRAKTCSSASSPRTSSTTSGSRNLARKIDADPRATRRASGCRPTRPAHISARAPSTAAAQHAWMRIVVVAQPPAEFDAWQTARARSRALPPSDAAASEARRTSRQDVHHAATPSAGRGDRGRVAPDLTHLAERSTLGAGVIDNNPARPRALAQATRRRQAREPHARPQPDATPRWTTSWPTSRRCDERRRHPSSTRRTRRRLTRTRRTAARSPGSATVDHKRIGILYLVTALFFFAVGGTRGAAHAPAARAPATTRCCRPRRSTSSSRCTARR